MAEFLPCLITLHATEMWVSGDTVRSFNLSTSWRLAVPVENSPWKSLKRKPCMPQIRSWRCGRATVCLPGTEAQTVPSSLYGLNYSGLTFGFREMQTWQKEKIIRPLQQAEKWASLYWPTAVTGTVMQQCSSTDGSITFRPLHYQLIAWTMLIHISTCMQFELQQSAKYIDWT